MTTHHVIPKHLKPKNNVLIRICQRCHDDINRQDLAGIMSFTFQIHKSMEETSKKINKLSNELTHFVKTEEVQHERKKDN